MGDSNDNKLGMDVEKTESSPTPVTQLEYLHDGFENILHQNTEEHCDAKERVDNNLLKLQEGIPFELRDRVFTDEFELWKVQEELGLPDFRIVLTNEGYAVWEEIQSVEHSAGVNAIRSQFHKWNYQEHGGKLLEDKVVILLLFESCDKDHRRQTRRPDFAIWGPDRMDRKKYAQRAVLGNYMNPHVIFQFSWGNTFEYERFAVIDMSLFVGVKKFEHLGRPNIIFLIKVVRKRATRPDGKVVVNGFDVYVVRKGETIINGAKPTLRYRVGSNEDVTIEVAPKDMGLPEDNSPFLVTMSEIRSSLEEDLETVHFEAAETLDE